MCSSLFVTSAANAQSIEGSPTIAGLAISDCAALTADPASLAVLLRLELASSLAAPVELVAGTPADARYQITIDCGEHPDDLLLRLERTTPAGEYRAVIALHDEPRAMRPRTLAIAVAENLRYVEAPVVRKETAAPVAIAPVTPVTPVRPSQSLTTPAPLPPRVQRYRDMSLGFGVPTATLLFVGSILVGVGVNHPDPAAARQIVPWGGTMLGFAVVGILGTGISVGILAKEKRKAAAAAAAAR